MTGNPPPLTAFDRKLCAIVLNASNAFLPKLSHHGLKGLCLQALVRLSPTALDLVPVWHGRHLERKSAQRYGKKAQEQKR
mgnify:CR=1 FL=1